MTENHPAGYRPTIHDLPAGERPRERLEHYGSAALSTAELLAILLRVGTGGENAVRMAERVLAHFDGLPGLAQASVAELCQAKGIGPAKAVQIKAGLELGRRLLVTAPHERPQVRSPADAANLLMAEMSILPQEHLRTVLLDTRNRVLRIPTVYVGSLNSAVVRVGEVFREAIRVNCAALIVVHNHPSGDPTPSPEDVQVTRMIVEAGDMLNIDVLDHLIIGRQRFVSLKERGL
ncbi:MAG: DNA repair protein RadC, partial [Chloroflexota bacterium]|nr:DNA repair protein RadC [Chloroflexota bacterium]